MVPPMARSDFAAADTSASVYDPNEIHTPSQDEKGHSVNLRLHVPVPWHGILQQIVSSDDWPEYRSIHDIVRDALYHRMHWIGQQKNREQFPLVYQALIRAHYDRVLTNFADEAVDWRRHAEKIDQVMQLQVESGNADSVKAYIEDFAPRLVHISEPYRTRLSLQLQGWAARAGIDFEAYPQLDPHYDPGITPIHHED